MKLNKLIGMTLEEALVYAEENNIKSRVVSVDGESRIVTSDFRIDRVNLTIENNIVTKLAAG